MSYAEWLTGLARGLRRCAVPEVATAPGAQMDQLRDEAETALLYGRATTCPDDGIGRLAITRGLWRYSNETEAMCRSRIARAWDAIWPLDGTERGLVEALRALGFGQVEVWGYARLKTIGLGRDPFGGNYGFFFVRIGAGFAQPRRWNDSCRWNDEGRYRWSVNEAVDRALEEAAAVIRSKKPVGRSCRFIQVRVGNEWSTIPLGETWEYDRDGYAVDYYLTNY